MSMRRQSLSIILILVGIYFIISLSRDVMDLLESRERILEEQEEVAELEKRQQELAYELDYVMSEEFVEQEARDKLLMGKPGETVIVLPEDRGKTGEGVSFSESGGKEKEELANWEKWLRLFL